MALVRFFARPALAAPFVVAGIDRIKNARAAGSQLAPLLARVNQISPDLAQYTTDQITAARVLGGVQAGAGSLLAIGKLPRLSASALIGTQAVNTWLDYNRSPDETEEEQVERRTRLLTNIALIGGVAFAAMDRKGKPSLAWRAEHAAKAARKKVDRSQNSLEKTGHEAKKKLESAGKDAKKDLSKKKDQLEKSGSQFAKQAEKKGSEWAKKADKATKPARKEAKSVSKEFSKDARKAAKKNSAKLSKNANKWQKETEKKLKKAGLI